jgi:predicted ATPase/DNA-binding SARP family transcriptional activator
LRRLLWRADDFQVSSDDRNASGGLLAFEVRLLGPVQIVRAGRDIALGGPRQRAVLALLVLQSGRVVSAGRLAEELWRGRPPPGAPKTLRSYVSRLRTLLAPDVELVARGGGYVLRADMDMVDAVRFEELAGAGQAALSRKDAAVAADRFRHALRLWRGDALTDVREAEALAREAARLEELRLTALEGRIEADLELGLHARVTGELEGLVTEHPLRERLWRLLILALYRSERQADALDAYRRARNMLATELGLEPGEELRRMEGAVLRQEILPASPPAMHNLPALLTSFLGREREVSEVRALVQSSRLVTLTGAGGIGKTRLGLQVADGLLSESEDGVWVVELAAVTDQDAVPAAISHVLRLAVQPGRPTLDALLDALALQDALIVMDNCEHLVGGCAKTAEAIVRRCPRVHLLATSREPLAIGGEIIYRVPSLSLPVPGDADGGTSGSGDAVALLVQRAWANGVALSVDEQAGPVVSVCRRLDGMPLAIELAAARLRSMSLAELHDPLDQRFRLLTGGSRTALERQQTLRATVAWSYALLTGAEQLLLRRLSVFAVGFGLAAAEGVCGSGGLDVLDVAALLGSLVDKSLVIAEPTATTLRYRLLETIRLFAAEQLAEAGEDDTAALAAAHCAYFLSVAETAAAYLTGPEQGRWLDRLDADQANLRRAAEYAPAARTGPR